MRCPWASPVRWLASSSASGADWCRINFRTRDRQCWGKLALLLAGIDHAGLSRARYGHSDNSNYIITSSIAGPALLHLEVPLLVSHMFVFYFGIMADLTPPVALAAFAAAPIARSPV